MKARVFVLIFALIITTAFGKICYANEKKNLPQLSSKSAIAIEWVTGKILFEKNKDLKLPMASTTKIMTAILVLENCDVNKEIEIPPQAVGVPGSSMYLEKGEKLKIIDLLYGLMLSSGNDAAVALAIATAGDVKRFVKLMNKKAKDLGLSNTVFSSPHGLEQGQHYTTAHDLAKLTAYAMRNPIFRQIVKTKDIEVPWTTRPYNRILRNKNKMLRLYPGADGVKTGFTKKAGRCLVTSVCRDDFRVICVVLNAPDMWNDTQKILNYCYNNFKVVKLLPDEMGYVKVKNGKSDWVKVGTTYKCYWVVESSCLPKLDVILQVAEAPIEKNKVIGRLNVYLKNEKQSLPLVALQECPRKSLWDRIKEKLFENRIRQK
ncbi:Serine-type D-Ala-D-Ala carboxypeptidase [Caldicellulosiruptor kronotskyensis 2002]|uniref:serine-type D-Ala-D-Ala carboxypeptidase n=1 Tax=Caldicellulosiruptor kronotskyensis (strain DSM 18902 / VKM B-2412 / 2002) TaxID=632348 RepID=E4SC42_CALK2|nr:D-alanyl-D-alanine carboxypeptidase family protein [Caldicellulosiruptor kronotskyensis]ADQ46277.1 Serine-type D-Ala-D-Ala carboxypeptidase [Caldicellulosiruptor kronotskyensis 2002]